MDDDILNKYQGTKRRGRRICNGGKKKKKPAGRRCVGVGVHVVIGEESFLISVWFVDARWSPSRRRVELMRRPNAMKTTWNDALLQRSCHYTRMHFRNDVYMSRFAQEFEVRISNCDSGCL